MLAAGSRHAEFQPTGHDIIGNLPLASQSHVSFAKRRPRLEWYVRLRPTVRREKAMQLVSGLDRPPNSKSRSGCFCPVAAHCHEESVTEARDIAGPDQA